MNRARIIQIDKAWHGHTGTIVSRSACGGVWFAPDEWPPGVPETVRPGEMWFAWNEFVEVSQTAAKAA